MPRDGACIEKYDYRRAARSYRTTTAQSARQCQAVGNDGERQSGGVHRRGTKQRTQEAAGRHAAGARGNRKLAKPKRPTFQHLFFQSKEKSELIRQLETSRRKEEETTLKLAELPSLYETIGDKDNELRRLHEELSHVRKQILQQDQLADRLRHFEAQQSLQTEVQESHNKIRDLQEKLKTLLQTTPNESINSDHVEDNNHALNEPKLCHNGNSFLLEKDAAMKYLEDKCTRTMNIVANLTEEKQSLEHLVTQLQGETETIAEYIALYQHQRGILQQRTLEKDEQLKRLVEDREKVHVKLDLLNGLVQKWMQEKGPVAREQACEVHSKSADPVQNVDQEAQEKGSVDDENGVSEANTAKQIMVLLSEIKSSNLVQLGEGSDDFHPCPWCYGRLETV